MKRKLIERTQGWLEAEGRGDVDADAGSRAETALARVFAALPVPAPGPELARRTLALVEAQLGLRPAQPHWAFRWAVSAALGLSGLALALYGPALLAALSWKGSVNWFVDLGAGLLAGASRQLATGYNFWDGIARAGETVAGAVATPQLLGVTLASVLLGLATLRALAGLVAVERSSYHV